MDPAGRLARRQGSFPAPLLRASFARGCATALVARAERHARERGARRIYLLTTTAADFFARLGYKRVEREQAPGSIRSTGEFSSLCPVTSVLMMKEL